MRLKTTFAALALATLPTLSFAMGCNWDHTPSSTTNVCEQGQTYDVTTGACVTQSTS